MALFALAWLRPTRPYAIPFVIDAGASTIIIAGYAYVRPYCQWLFMGPYNTAGSSFLFGLSLMLAGSIFLGVFRAYRIGVKRRMSLEQDDNQETGGAAGDQEGA